VHDDDRGSQAQARRDLRAEKCGLGTSPPTCILLDGTPVIRFRRRDVRQISCRRSAPNVENVPSKTLQMQKPLRVPSQDPIEIAGW
jgi:hypothetical protein